MKQIIFRYITDNLKNTDTQDEIFLLKTNKINSELVKSLQSQDGAYSLAQTDDGQLGVKFGIILIQTKLNSQSYCILLF